MTSLAKKKIITKIKEWLYKFLVKKLFGTTLGGIKGFLFKLGFDFLWKKVIDPGRKYLWRKVKTFIRKLKYNKKAEKLKDAKTKEEFNSATDDLP